MTRGDHYEPDVFVWLPGSDPLRYTSGTQYLDLQLRAIRAHYYTSVVGDSRKIDKIRTALWDLGFQPEVFKKGRQDVKAKGVDIALTTHVLSHAHMGNYDAALLVVGDGDYLPLIKEVQRLGKSVYVNFFRHEGLNPDLRLAADVFLWMDDAFIHAWSEGTPMMEPPRADGGEAASS